MSNDTAKYNPYRRGADDGFLLGAYLVLLFFALAFSMKVSILGMIAMGMILAVPAVIYLMLARSFRAQNGLASFSSLWMQGIVTFFGGSLILAVVMMVYLRWIDPSFMADRLTEAIQIYRDLNQPRATEVADTLQLILDQNIIPSATDVALEVIWAGVFTGSLLSMLIALLVRARRRSSSPKSTTPKA